MVWVWVTFCNPQTMGRVVDGMGYIFVTREHWVRLLSEGWGGVSLEWVAKM